MHALITRFVAALLPLLLVLLALLTACDGRERRPRRVDGCQEYEPPKEDGSCDAPAIAHEIAWFFGRGEMCTVECEDELDCPTIGSRFPHCLKVSPATPFLCYGACRSHDDCPEDWVCQPVSTGTSVCLP